MYIKYLPTGEVRKYGENHHDSLIISQDGRFLSYSNLQNGDCSDKGDIRFVLDEDGLLPSDAEAYQKYGGCDAYFNIGGFPKEVETSDDELTTHDIMKVFGSSIIEPPRALRTKEDILNAIRRYHAISHF